MIICARPAYWIALPVLLLLPPTFARAQTSLSIRTNFYAVTGNTMRQLSHSLARVRPRNGATPYDGLTVWQIHWKIATRQHGKASRLTSFTTQTAITITLPRWLAPTNAGPELVQAWNDYVSALDQHEQGHVQLVRATVAELHTRAWAVSSGTDANLLQKQIDTLAQGIVAGGEQSHRNYDFQTNHGKTQGARLRPGPHPTETATPCLSDAHSLPISGAGVRDIPSGSR